MLAQLKYGRAAWTFCVAYVVVTVLAIALSVGIGMGMNLPPTEEPMQNQAYLISERFLPAMNLVVWGVFCGGLFPREREDAERGDWTGGVLGGGCGGGGLRILRVDQKSDLA